MTWPQDKLLSEYISFATKELGTIKMNEIIKKLNKSNVVFKFIGEAKRLNTRLGTDDFVGCIHSSSSFFFSKAETISVASLSLLIKWNYEVGIPNGLSDNPFINKRIFSILEKCASFKTHIRSSVNFFDRFFDVLDKKVLKELSEHD